MTRSPLAAPTSPEIEAGHAVYTPRTLALYDALVLGFSSRCIWRCPADETLALYDQFVSANHLEVGVGTGYFLDRCRFPVDRPRVVLADLNPHCLATAGRRIARYDPQTLTANLLEPFPWTGPPFDSIGLNFVLHCIPGEFVTKGIAFQYLGKVLAHTGVLFGSTLLAEGVSHNFLSRRLMRFYNRRGIFSNQHDSLPGLEQALSSHFGDIEIRTRGAAALFVARKPRKLAS